jgi:hypothetical protein
MSDQFTRLPRFLSSLSIGMAVCAALGAWVGDFLHEVYNFLHAPLSPEPAPGLSMNPAGWAWWWIAAGAAAGAIVCLAAVAAYRLVGRPLPDPEQPEGTYQTG